MMIHARLDLNRLQGIVECRPDRHVVLDDKFIPTVLQVNAATPATGEEDLYAAAYRTVPGGEVLSLQSWVEPLSLGASLPVLPLWISEDLSLPINLEAAYLAACAARRIG